MLSIIIPCLNEASTLPALLASLARQTRLPDEVIVADAGSQDGTADLARASGAQVVPGGRPAAGRNAGVRAARSLYLLKPLWPIPTKDPRCRAPPRR